MKQAVLRESTASLSPISRVRTGSCRGRPRPVGRINFRPPEQLKQRIEEAAARDGLSVNAWLTRALTNVLSGGASSATPPKRTGAFVGWVG